MGTTTAPPLSEVMSTTFASFQLSSLASATEEQRTASIKVALRALTSTANKCPIRTSASDLHQLYISKGGSGRFRKALVLWARSIPHFKSSWRLHLFYS